MDQEKLHEIVSAMMETLQNAPEGYRATSAQLLTAAGYQRRDFNGLDLTEIHYALLAEAEQAGLTLDLSSHDGREEGMPYNLDFVLRK